MCHWNTIDQTLHMAKNSPSSNPPSQKDQSTWCHKSCRHQWVQGDIELSDHGCYYQRKDSDWDSPTFLLSCNPMINIFSTLAEIFPSFLLTTIRSTISSLILYLEGLLIFRALPVMDAIYWNFLLWPYFSSLPVSFPLDHATTSIDFLRDFSSLANFLGLSYYL